MTDNCLPITNAPDTGAHPLPTTPAGFANLPPVITDKRGFAARWQFSTRTVDNLLAQGMPAIFYNKRRVRIVIAEADLWMREKFATRRLGPKHQ